MGKNKKNCEAKKKKEYEAYCFNEIALEHENDRLFGCKEK